MRIALLGLGFMGRTHLAALKSIPDAKLTAVFVPDLAQIHTSVQGNLGGASEPPDLGDARVYTDIPELLKDRNVDVVDICLPTDLHADTAIAAFEAGKHVLVEKPMAVDPLSASEVIAAAKKAKKTLMAAHVLRFFPAYRKLQEITSGGSLGPLRNLSLRRVGAAPTWATWFSDSAKSGGAVLDMLIHDADIALAMFGVPASISSVGYRDMRRAIDVVSAHLHYDKGPAVSINGGWYHPKSYPFSMGYTAVFDEGTLEFAGGEVNLYRVDGSSEKVALEDTDPYADEIRYFLECCRDGKAPSVSPPEQSAQAVELCLRMAEARHARH